MKKGKEWGLCFAFIDDGGREDYHDCPNHQLEVPAHAL
jgi:hypothetical protein